MIGANGSAAYADIDPGVAVAVIHNRFGGPGLFVQQLGVARATDDVSHR